MPGLRQEPKDPQAEAACCKACSEAQHLGAVRRGHGLHNVGQRVPMQQHVGGEVAHALDDGGAGGHAGQALLEQQRRGLG
jgi:hypothetical protein